MAHFVVTSYEHSKSFTDSCPVAVCHSKAEAVNKVRSLVLKECEKRGLKLPNFTPDDEQFGVFCDDPKKGQWLVNKEDRCEIEDWSLCRTSDSECWVDDTYLHIAFRIHEVD